MTMATITLAGSTVEGRSVAAETIFASPRPRAMPMIPPTPAMVDDSMRNWRRMSLAAGPDGHPDADLLGPLGHGHEHDVHDHDAPDQQGDRGDGDHGEIDPVGRRFIEAG